MPFNVKILAGPRRGFAANVNLLAAQVTTEWILLVNNDVVLHTGSGKRLKYFMRWASSRVGLAATSVWQQNGRLDSYGDTFSWWLARPLKRGRGTADVVRADRLPLLSVSGAVMMIRTKLWRELGGFDEGFSQYYEDVDFGWRALAAGWRIDCIPGCNSTHVGGQSFSTKDKAFFGARNNLWLIRRHQPEDKALLKRAEQVWRFKARRSPPKIAAAIERGLVSGRVDDVPTSPSTKNAARKLMWLHPGPWQEWGLIRDVWRHRTF
jgi:GT2 family glycosyltransferase